MNKGNFLNIGLFGFGVVGEGIYKVLQQTPSLNATIKKVCIRQKEKKRNASASLFTTKYEDLLHDNDINLIVELIDDAADAYEIVTTALKLGKPVVSANKKMIAENLPELLQLQKMYGTPFLYEAAVGGSIPIIRNLEEYYDNDLLHSFSGIINGSTNYILTKIISDGLSIKEALLEAQVAGFAESNPKLDISGQDAVNKLTILLLHAYGVFVRPEDLLFTGIEHIDAMDIRYAREKGYRIKLVAQAVKLHNKGLAAFVLPQFVNSGNLLHGVQNEYNGMVLESRLADKQFLYGKGAGRYPTSSAVLSDISALHYNYRYEYKKRANQSELSIAADYFFRVYVSFNNWEDVDKMDFEFIEELHSTEERQYLLGVIHFNKLKEADWFFNPAVSVIACPDPVVQKEEIVGLSLKKISLQLAGVSD